MIAGESAVAVLVGTLLAALAALSVLAAQTATLARFVARVPVSVPWAAAGQAVALCGVIAVTASVLSAWRITRRRAVDLAGLRD